MAYLDGIPKAEPILLEPIVDKVNCPNAYTGSVIGDLNKRRGMIMGMDAIEDNGQLITAEVPMVEVGRYLSDLRSITQGQASYESRFYDMIQLRNI